MTYTSFDPRITVRAKIGTLWDIDLDGTQEYCISVTDSSNDTVYIPMYLSEEVQSSNLPTFPFLEMETRETLYEPHDIGARTRKMESYISIHIFFTDTDNITRTTFAKTIKDKLHDLVRTNQSTTEGITFMNIDSDSLLRETDGRQVVYHYIAVLYCLYYDLC
jgi:hypothetical protein